MSRRGEIVVECDNADCYAEQVLDAAELQRRGMRGAIIFYGWRATDPYVGKDVCPMCVEEGR